MTLDQNLLLIGAGSAVIGSLITALLTFIASTAKNRNEKRRDTVADRDGLIEQFQETVNLLRGEVNELRAEVGKVRDHNNVLIAYVYRLLAVLRHNQLQEEIPEPTPDGIHL